MEFSLSRGGAFKNVLTGSRGTNSKTIRTARDLLLASLLILTVTLTGGHSAKAQQPVIQPGDAIITGFSGITQFSDPAAPAKSPLDKFFIDSQSASLKIFSLQTLDGSAANLLLPLEPEFSVSAGEIGQVFATALQPQPSSAPSIYAGATSLFGLQIVKPSESGIPQRLKNGTPGAQWMDGQFGVAMGGGPGSIYRIDGATGEVSLFANIPDNNGTGVGDIAYDETSGQFFASDLETGLIYRLGENGSIIDSFDHGVTARKAIGLPVIPDSGNIADISSPAFDVEKPESWGYPQDERQVWGITSHEGRIYYAVSQTQPEIWSVGLNGDGTFADDSRMEIQVAGLKAAGPITDILFDKTGAMLLAQRGAIRGSYDYSVFAEPGETSLLRYAPDPNAPAGWQLQPGQYPVGLMGSQRYSNGGIALGYAHDETGNLQPNSCSAELWVTGSRLGSSQQDGSEEADIHGAQGIALYGGNANKPAYLLDFDNQFFDASKAGHIGDIEIWHICSVTPIAVGPDPEVVTCPAGYTFDGTDCVRNTGKPPAKAYCPEDMDEVDAWQVGELRASGWTVIKVGSNRWCGRPGETIIPEIPCPFGMDEIPFEEAEDFEAAGWIVIRLDGTNKWCGRPGPPPPPPVECTPPSLQIADFDVDDRIAAGWTVVRNGPIWCGRPPAIIDPAPCPPGLININGICIPIIKTCPPGSVGNYPVCLKVCPIGSIGVWPGCLKKCPPGKVGIWPACVKKPICKVGFIFKNGKCRPIIKKCPPGKIGIWPACVKKPKCKVGYVFKNGKCQPIIKKCPPGTIGLPPACIKKPKCKVGFVFKNGKCVPIIKKCPPGTVGVPPACVKKPKCKIGFVFKNGKCVPIIKKCPPGTIGVPPACVKKPKCKIGFVFKNGKCVPIIKKPKCKIGYIFKNGKCVPIIKKPKCKIGYIFKNGKCVPIIKKPKCKIGYIFKNGKCVPIIKKPKCKIGYIFKNGKCVPIIKKPKCKIGQVFKNGKCVPIIKKCPPGTVGVPPACVKKPQCKIGFIMKNGKCVPIVSKPKCKIGQIYKNGKCVPIIKKPKCKIGQVFKNGKCVPLVKFPKL